VIEVIYTGLNYSEILDEDWPAVVNSMQNTTGDIVSQCTDDSRSHVATSKLVTLGIKRHCASELYEDDMTGVASLIRRRTCASHKVADESVQVSPSSSITIVVIMR
jgi:hypothetical protein